MVAAGCITPSLQRINLLSRQPAYSLIASAGACTAADFSFAIALQTSCFETAIQAQITWMPQTPVVMQTVIAAVSGRPKLPDAGETLPSASVRDLGALLKDSGYEVFLKNGSLYGFKGISGRFAPIAVHVSLVLILFGAAVGALGGLDGQVLPPCHILPLHRSDTSALERTGVPGWLRERWVCCLFVLGAEQ